MTLLRKESRKKKEKETSIELKRMNELMIGRELKMVELKEELTVLKNKSK